MEDLLSIVKFAEQKNIPTHNLRGLYVEYLQYEILRSIFRHTAKLSFIGGTALRIIFNSKRFSEDLDFDNFGLNENDFADLSGKIQKDMNMLGFTVEFKNVYKGAYHCYFHFSDILYRYGFSPHVSEKILVRVDTVIQDYPVQPSVSTLNNFGIFFQARHNPPDILLSQKMIAALERKRGKGRDFFDITFLLGFTSPHVEYLRHKIGIKTLPELKERLLARCAEIDFEKMAGDVENFLFNREDRIRITKFRDYIAGWQVA